jgi:hypothetical protein
MTKSIWVSFLAIVGLCVPIRVTGQADSTLSSCPVTFLKFEASGFNGVYVRVRNNSTKKIVGLTFNAALADATEHWNWLGWPDLELPYSELNGRLSDSGTLRGFGWNKELKPGEAKTTSWDRDLGHEHGGGVAFVLISALFDDGSRWDELPDRASCVALWHNNHKKGIAKSVVLPPRPPVEAHTVHY